MSRRFTLAAGRALCLAAAVALLQTAAWAGAARGAQERGRSYVTGTVVGISGRLAGRSRPFRLVINNYTPAADVQRLTQTLQSGGEDALLRELSNLNSGRVQIGNNVGVVANAIIATPQDGGGTKLTVLFERNISIFERRYGTRSEDYRFGYAEIFLGRNGTGEGTFIPAARVRLRGTDIWEVEDFGVFPARLLGARLSGGNRRL